MKKGILFIVTFGIAVCFSVFFDYKMSDSLSEVKGENTMRIAVGATYYVSAAGNDSNNGTSTSTPWKSLSKVKGHAYTPGDKILFRAGDLFDYTPAGTFSVQYSGTAGNEITFGRYGTGANPQIKNMQVDGTGTREKASLLISGKSYIIVDGIDSVGSSTAFQVVDSDHITLRNFSVTGTTPEGCGVGLDETSENSLTHDITIEDFTIVGNGSMGWGICGSEFVLRTITVSRGSIDGVGQAGGEQKHGMYINNWQGFTVEDLTITDAWNTGIKVVSETTDGIFRRITIIHPGNNGSGGSGPGISLGDTRISHIRRLTFENVVVWKGVDPALWIIDYVNGVHDITVNHCTFVQNGSPISLPQGTTGWSIKNTIGFQDSAWISNDWRVPLLIEDDEADIANNTFDYNDWYFKNGSGSYNPVRVVSNTLTLAQWKAKASNPDAHSISVNPNFKDYANGDFHLQDNSPYCTAGEGGTYLGAYSCAATPTPTPTPTPTATATATPTATPTPTPTTTAPLVTSTSVTTITSTTATVNCNVTSSGGSAILERGVAYSTTNATPTTSNSKKTATGTTGTVQVSLTGLVSNSAYHLRCYARNALGTSYGSVINFSTLSASTPTPTATVTPTPTPTVPAALNNVYFTFAKFRYNKYASPAALRTGDMAYIKNYDQSKLRLLQVFLYDYAKKGNQGYTKSKVTSTSMFLRTDYNLPTGKRYAYVMKFQDKTTGIIATKYFVVYTTKTWLGKSVL